MNAHTSAVPSTDKVLAMVRGELTSPRRWFYRAVLLAASVAVGVILSLWTTEPGPLPLRLHLAFGALTVIGFGWIVVLTWILWRRYCPAALDRIATGWVATGACLLFLGVGLGIALARDRGGVWGVAATGVFFLSVAVGLLWRSYALRATLKARLAELERNR